MTTCRSSSKNRETTISNLKDHAIGNIERKAREEVAKVLTYMKDRTQVWTNGEDIPSITTTAHAFCLKLLSSLAAICLNEDTETISEMLDLALGGPNNTQDILVTNTWEKVLATKTLVTPVECISVWNQLLRETEYTITQAIASQVYTLTQKELDEATATYGIPMDLNPRLPPSDEVSFYTLFKYVIQTQFRKKRDKNATLQDFDQVMVSWCLETASEFTLTSSTFKSNDVTVFCDGVTR
ncbi:root hair defective 3-like protein [Tanacetum coccineum]